MIAVYREEQLKHNTVKFTVYVEPVDDVGEVRYDVVVTDEFLEKANKYSIAWEIAKHCDDHPVYENYWFYNELVKIGNGKASGNIFSHVDDTTQMSSPTDLAGQIKKILPGLSQQVKCPEECGPDKINPCSCGLIDCPLNGFYPETLSLWAIIQHLNDTHKWSREAIADWLETLDVDLTFGVANDGNQ